MSSIDLRLYEAIIKIEKIVSMSAKISIFFNIFLGLCLLDPHECNNANEDIYF